ncbi:MAG: hypothetical protein PHW69_03350 [Elusimicrobiaceae bacterium]|nr:hypothetical protein [Elusimicrobiaceae bacterium]
MKKALWLCTLAAFFCAAGSVSAAGAANARKKNSAQTNAQAGYLASLIGVVDTAKTRLEQAQRDESAFYRRLGWDNGRVRGLIDLNTFLPCLEKRRALAKYYGDSAASARGAPVPAKHTASHRKFITYLAAREAAETGKLARIDQLLADWKNSLEQDEKTAVFPADKIHQTFNFWPADHEADTLRRDWAAAFNREYNKKRINRAPAEL